MSNREYALLESQILDTVCEIEDTEEIFWLRESDDYQSRVSLGNALAKQYRFKDAIVSYENALRIRQNDPLLYLRLGGANLTLFRFEQAKKYYELALSLGAKKESISYPLGIWYFMKREYSDAMNYFSSCLPCDGEMKIAVLYWHTLAAYRANSLPTLLNEYKSDMDVGHHAAYKTAVSVFCNETDWTKVTIDTNDLVAVITLYGLSLYLEHIGQITKAEEYAQEVLDRKSVWPCISYLAAWNDRNILT